MLIGMATSVPSSAYPSPPPSFSTPRTPSIPSSNGIMGGNSTTNVDGVGALNYQRALDIARNTEGDLDPNVRDYLERALSDIWARVQSQPDVYIFTKDEFAVFNYYIQRFEGLPETQPAIARYWQHTREPSRN